MQQPRTKPLGEYLPPPRPNTFTFALECNDKIFFFLNPRSRICYRSLLKLNQLCVRLRTTYFENLM